MNIESLVSGAFRSHRMNLSPRYEPFSSKLLWEIAVESPTKSLKSRSWLFRERSKLCLGSTAQVDWVSDNLQVQKIAQIARFRALR
jgi:hypothetical protein